MKKWQPLLLAAIMSLGIGMVLPFSGIEAQQAQFLGIILVIPLYWWLQLDSNQYPELNLSTVKVWAGLFALIGLPLYFIKTRGLSGSLVPIVLSVVAFGLSTVLTLAGWYLSVALFFR
jgi:hypothetical protein